MTSNDKQAEDTIERSRPKENAREKENARSNENGVNDLKQFEQMLDSHDPIPLKRGQIVEGEILKLEEHMAIIDVGAKRDAIVPPEEMVEVDDTFLEQLDEGDNVYVYVTRTPVGDEELIVSLEKGLREQDWERAADYLESQEVLELKVIGKNRGGLLVEFGRLQGFVPNSHVPALGRIYDREERMKTKSELVDSTVSVKVLEIDRPRKRLVLSAKAAGEELRQKRLVELKLQEGETITAKVTSLVDFGAFLNLGGIEGLLHISEIAWEMVESPADFLTPGEAIEVLIQSVNVERERVSLSRKALIPSPWEVFAQTHKEGDLVEGVVTNVVDFGVFVLISEGIEGLIHITEMDREGYFSPQDVLYPGDTILARILNVDPEQERLALSQKQVSQEEEVEWIRQRQRNVEMSEFDEEE